VVLKFENLETVPADFEILLLDETTRIVRDLRTQPEVSVRMPAKSKVKSLSILVGNENFIFENVGDLAPVPTDFALHQNYPNPFNPSTTIRYQLPVGGKVTLKVFDLLGRQTLTLEDENEREPGYYETVVDLSSMASGVYFYRIAVSGEQKFAATKKMLLVK